MKNKHNKVKVRYSIPKQSKHNQIKEHLQSGRAISGRGALNIYGVYRLSSVINRLRNKGLKIQTAKVTVLGVNQYAIYSIID